MTYLSPFRYFKTSPEVIQLAVMLYGRFPFSLRNVGGLLHERGIDVSHETVRFRWKNNCAENSNLPLGRRERAMLMFRRNPSFQKFVAVHSSIHNHLDQERHLYSRHNSKLNRIAALSEWRELCSG